MLWNYRGEITAVHTLLYLNKSSPRFGQKMGAEWGIRVYLFIYIFFFKITFWRKKVKITIFMQNGQI